MKKISMLAILLVAGLLVYAQPPKFGIKGGVNIATLQAPDKFDSRIGIHAGFLSHIHLSPAFALQPEVMYSGQGAKYTISDGEHNLELGYVNIPLNLQYMFNNGFRLQTGPQLGLLVHVSDRHNGQETNFFSSDDFKRVDLAWTVGLGYLTHSGLGIDARYNLGLNNINDMAGGGSRKNNVIQLGLFYMFDNNHKARSR